MNKELEDKLVNISKEYALDVLKAVELAADSGQVDKLEGQLIQLELLLQTRIANTLNDNMAPSNASH